MDLNKFVLSFKDADGKIQSVTRNVPAELVTVASVGMAAAHQADSAWADNFDAFISFFNKDYEPGINDTSAMITTALRGSQGYAEMYDFLTQNHPKFATAEEYRVVSLNAEGGKVGNDVLSQDSAKVIYTNQIVKIRVTSNSQAKRIVFYFADANGVDGPESERKLPSARTLIEGWINEANDKLEKPRGPITNEADKVLLRTFVNAARIVLSDEVKLMVSKQGTSLLNLETPQPATKSTAGAADKAAGKVTVYKGAAAEAVIAK